MVDYESSKIPDGGENPDSWSHWDIYRAFNPLVTTNAQHAATAYADIAKDWSSAMSYFVNRVNQSSTAAWSGAAAEASRNAMTKYGNAATETTDAINDMANNVTTAIAGVTGTKSGVPEPVNSVSGWNPRGWDLGFWEGSRSKSKIDEEQNSARDNMKKYYVDNFAGADSKIAVLPDPNPINSPINTYTPAPASGTPNSGTAANSGANHGGGGNSTHNSGSNSGNTGYSGTGGQSGTSSDASTAPSGYQSSDTPSSSSTIPSGVYSGLSPSNATAPSSFTGGTGAGSGGDDTTGFATTPGGGPNSGGGLGKSVPGTTTAAKAAATTAAANAGKTTAGMTGMGGMGGAGKKGESDKEHGLPEWLRTMENTEDLLGPTPKTIPGGVIGGDYDKDPNAEA